MATTTSKPRKTGPKRPDTCRLTLTIRGADYRVRPVASEDGRTWRFRKLGTAEVHHARETTYGPACDCPDFVWRREGLDPEGCKHIRAARALGLID